MPYDARTAKVEVYGGKFPMPVEKLYDKELPAHLSPGDVIWCRRKQPTIMETAFVADEDLSVWFPAFIRSMVDACKTLNEKAKLLGVTI